MSLKNDAKAECERLQYLLDNYRFESDNEKRLVEDILNNIKRIYQDACYIENHKKELH